MKKIFSVLLAALTIMLFSSCSMLIRQNGQSEKAEQKANKKNAAEEKGKTGGLTPEQIAKMSPEDLRRHYEEQQKKAKAKAFSEELGRSKMTEEERRNARRNVNRQMTPEEMGSAFPWKGSYTRRSEELHDSMSLDR